MLFFGFLGQNSKKKKCFDRIGTGTYSNETAEKMTIFEHKKGPKKGKTLILMYIFLNNVPGTYSIETPEFWGSRLLFWLC